MLSIPNLVYQLEIAKDVTYKQMLLLENIDNKHKTIARFLKKN